MRSTTVALLFVTLALSAAPAKKKPATPIAANEVPHVIAQFLRTMSKDGARTVTFKATAVGTRFFFEEPIGVTVYRFDDGRYIKEEFLSGATLPRVVKRYAKK
jgi:hypothetical protein